MSIQYTDLTGKGVNKGRTLLALRESINFQPQELAVICYQAIDLYMLQYAGLLITM